MKLLWSSLLLPLLAALLTNVPVNGLHCHRKHDHSADILLQGTASEQSLSAQNVEVAAAASSYTARLVQEVPRYENKRELLMDHQEILNQQNKDDTFCPNLNGCSCNVTSGTNRLQVISLHILKT